MRRLEGVLEIPEETDNWRFFVKYMDKAVLLAALLAFGESTVAEAYSTARLFPLARGNSWSIPGSIPGLARSLQVGSTITTVSGDESPTVALWISGYQRGYSAYVAADADGVRLHKISYANWRFKVVGSVAEVIPAQLSFDPPLRLAAAEVLPGQTVISSGSAQFSVGWFRFEGWQYSASTEFGAPESVSTANGAVTAVPATITVNATSSGDTRTFKTKVWLAQDAGIVQLSKDASSAPVSVSRSIVGDEDCLFSWAEVRYSKLFPNAPATATYTSGSGAAAVTNKYRHYSATNSYLVANKSDGQVYAQIPSLGMSNPVSVGSLGSLAANARGTGCR